MIESTFEIEVKKLAGKNLSINPFFSSIDFLPNILYAVFLVTYTCFSFIKHYICFEFTKTNSCLFSPSINARVFRAEMADVLCRIVSYVAGKGVHFKWWEM
jgi:hypothetical protein